MKKTLTLGLITMLLLAFTFASAFSEEEKKEKQIPPRVQKWFDKLISFDANGWELDTCIAICKKLTDADIMFEVDTDAKLFPKIWYKSDRYKFKRVLEDLLKGTKFDWRIEGERIIIGKRLI